MKPSITTKLFLAILMSCMVVVMAMGAAMRISFEHGFLDYVTNRNAVLAARLTRNLERAYVAHGGWQFVIDQPNAWNTLLDATVGGMPDNRASSRPASTPFATLYDTNQQPIAGAVPPPGVLLRPLKAAGATIGWLSIDDLPAPFRAADQRFQAEQLRVTWSIVGGAVLLAAVLAIVLSRMLIAPVRRLAEATHRLAGGDYATRVAERGGDELGRLAGSFNRLAASLESDAWTRRNFIADVSHELRTPLAIMRGELEALEDGVRLPSAATFASMQTEVTMLNQLIDDLHELSLADIGALKFENVHVDLGSLVADVAESYRERLASKRIALELSVQPDAAPISGDPCRLTQLMQNLLENALRYTEAGGKVRVAMQRLDERWQIDVQDSLPAVPELLLPHLFDRLFRVDASHSHRSGGSGLGLALCKSIAEAHGGAIDALRSPYGGLWIRLRLPVSASSHGLAS